MSQPAVAAGWSSQRWMDFSKKMASHVRSFKKDGYAVLGQLLIPVGIIIIIIELASPLRVGRGGQIFPGLCRHLRPQHVDAQRANQAIHAKIKALCRQFSSPRCSLRERYDPRGGSLVQVRAGTCSFLPISQ